MMDILKFCVGPPHPGGFSVCAKHEEADPVATLTDDGILMFTWEQAGSLIEFLSIGRKHKE